MSQRSQLDGNCIPGSAEELHAWASGRLRGGVAHTRLIPGLVERGLPRQLAEHFARDIADQTYPERRTRALRLTAEGGVWLGGSLLGLLIIHQTAGTWSAHGPWLLGWGVVACGVLRLVGGVLALPPQGTSKRRPVHRAAMTPSDATGRASLLDFQTLGLGSDASPQAIHDSYRELARIWHPDRFADSAEIRVRAEQRMKRINAAYSRLSRSLVEQPS